MDRLGESFLCRLGQCSSELYGRERNRLQRRGTDRGQQKRLDQLIGRHKKFLKVKGVSGGVAGVLWNTKRLMVFLEQEEMRYSIGLHRLPVQKPPIFEGYEKCLPKLKIYVTYAIALDDCLVFGNNYGCLTKLPQEVTIKIHSGDILHIAHRNNLLLTCSEDSTCQLVSAGSLQPISMLKDEKYMKETPSKGAFIDEFRAVVCSRLYAKVFGLPGEAERVCETLLLVELVTDPTTKFQIHNDILLYNLNGSLRYVVLEKLAGLHHFESSLDLRETRVDCFCLMSNGLLAVTSEGILKAVRIVDGSVMWSLPLAAINIPGKQGVASMEYCNGSLYLLDRENGCVKLPIPESE